MKKTFELLTVSLRVLTAINNKQHPAQSDLDYPDRLCRSTARRNWAG
jgi:hypothetical protein